MTGVLRNLCACAIACAFICLSATALTACVDGRGDTREAGRVFDHVFTEQDVIDYLADFRRGNATEDNADWAAWMESRGTDAESLRKEVVGYLAENWLVERAAGLLGISVSDEEVGQALDKQKAEYSSELAWTRALINSGYTADAYALSVKSDLIKQQIKEHFADPASVSDEDLEEYANNRMTAMRTKRSSAVFVSSSAESGGNMAAKAKAEQAKAELDAGVEFGPVFGEYSSTEYSGDGDMGYDYYSTPSRSYNSALSGLLEVGDVSEVVESEGGYFVIVLTDVFPSSEHAGYLKLKKFPDELLGEFRSELARQQADGAYEEFYTENVSKAQVAIEPMPEGLPYDVQLEGKES